MISRLKNIDVFSKNIIIVFAGTSVVNVFNLLFQLLIAHKLSVSEFAAFNSLLAIFLVISAPLSTIQMAVAKYSSEFNARNQVNKVRFLLSDLFKRTLVLAVLTLLAFWFISVFVIKTLKIPSVACGYILSGLLAVTWLLPVFYGGVQGLEFFGWLSTTAVVVGFSKLAFAFIFIMLGLSIAGALGALLASSLIGLAVSYFPIRHFFSSKADIPKEHINYKEIYIYLFPVAISYFCFITLVSFDMVLVKYFFSSFDSGLYSIAQMLGKIFLFLPAAISLVMFPRTSGLNARNMDTIQTLRRSLWYVLALCIIAVAIYNAFPAIVLKILTGKVYQESISLGRLFSISMSFFTLTYVLIAYFLSIKRLQFIKYMVFFTILQNLAIVVFHQSLFQVQFILCINSILLFFVLFFLVKRKDEKP